MSNPEHFYSVLDFATSDGLHAGLSHEPVSPEKQTDWGLAQIIRGNPISRITPTQAQIQAAAQEWARRHPGGERGDWKLWARECNDRVERLTCPFAKK